MTHAAAADPVLRHLRMEIDRLYGDRVERVVLFGSRARGDHRPDSDYDVAVFLTSFDDWFVEAKRIIDASYDRLGSAGPLISPKVFHGASLDQQHPLLREIAREGLPI